MSTPVLNFAKVQVSTGYDSVATSVTLITGHGSRLPNAFPYPLVWFNATSYPDPSDDPDVEIVTVTNRVADILTITRGVEGTTASNKNTSGVTYKMVQSLTAAMWDSIFNLALGQDHRGLRLSNHPDSDKAAKAVQFSADAIVMSDGEQVTNWTNMTADITTAGLNGLDTGSESGSTWYEVYAIRNSVAGTKGSLLHQAKDYGGGVAYTSGEDGGHALRDAAARTKLAQGFQVSTASGLCEFVDVKLIRTGAPVGNYWFTIEANSGGAPTGTPLATSDKYNAGIVNTVAQTVRIPFRTPATLSTATQYHLVMQGDYAVSGANYIAWRADITAAAYANGSKSAFDGATWSPDTDDDFIFSVYITRNSTALTMPTGYDQYALLGYVRNNASSDFKRFFQIGRRVSCGYDTDWAVTTSLTKTTADLLDFQSFIPPLPCIADLTVYDATAAHFMFGHISITDLDSSPPTNKYPRSVRGTVNAAWTETVNGLQLEYSGAIATVSIGTMTVYVGGYEF
jgi:hypothetical protein